MAWRPLPNVIPGRFARESVKAVEPGFGYEEYLAMNEVPGMAAKGTADGVQLDNPKWSFAWWHWLLVAAALGLLAFVCFDGLQHMAGYWKKDEYSHGYMLPFVAAFFVWQRSTQLIQTPFQASWFGVLVALFGLFVCIAGELGTLYSVIQYGFFIALGGILLSVMGWRAFRLILPAYVMLFFLVPLPNFLYNSLSAELQLISSQLGVAVIRLFGIPVFLEGNVIDLGHYQMQVVEACSGLRYLFPLTALGYIAAMIFNGALWKRLLLFASTMPIAVLMNSFRIGMIGVLVNYAGIGMAEGFLHDFEGWAVFMACAALLVLEMWLLARVGRDRLPLREAFAIEGPDPLPKGESAPRRLPWSFYAVIPALLGVAMFFQSLPHREEIIPERAELLFFPREVGEWRGRSDRLEKIYVDALKLDDYLLVDYVNPEGASANLYVAYYDSQRKGASVHSPKSCLPGGGWRIEDFSQRDIPLFGSGPGSDPLTVNRALIQMGEERLLVYYWFQQRGRVMTNEYLVKWFLFWDALTRSRTDGALVRLTAQLEPGQDPAEVDAILAPLADSVFGLLGRFIPE